METMTESQFSILIDKIDHLDQRMSHMDQRMGHMDQRMGHMDQRMTNIEQRMTRMDHRMGVLTGVFIGGIILILTAAGIYTNVILAVQNLN